MRSWSGWRDLTAVNVNHIPRNAKGVYVIRVKTLPQTDEAWPSDILYIGMSGTGVQGVGKRLRNLLKALSIDDDQKASAIHCAAPKMRPYTVLGLEFSWFECRDNPDGAEKGLLLAHYASVSRLPPLNDGF